MKDYKMDIEKKTEARSKKNYSDFIIKTVLVFFILFLLLQIYKQEQEIIYLKKAYEDIDYEYKEKQKKLKKLQEEFKHSDSLEFVEKQARERLKMVKPNEKVYVDVNKND